jgi:hypothetical protein
MMEGKSVGVMKFPIYGKKTAPNHQPDEIFKLSIVCLVDELLNPTCQLGFSSQTNQIMIDHGRFKPPTTCLPMVGLAVHQLTGMGSR